MSQIIERLFEPVQSVALLKFEQSKLTACEMHARTGYKQSYVL